ncbi:hypothetical protein Ocin01_04684 [Orchesella cincta]|uniref:Gustatory receptor n=1 Tax=Orchesella cincta TaxID=48709 RepID=A0A1D2NA85_ORCCI|nr:hypothetical protein Ocin01_04684 [Orchesella cincta]
MSCENMKSVASFGKVTSVEENTIVCVATEYSSDESEDVYRPVEHCEVNVEQVVAASSSKSIEVTPSSSSPRQEINSLAIPVVEKRPREDEDGVQYVEVETRRPAPAPTSRQGRPTSESVGKTVAGERGLDDSSEITTIREFTSEQSTSVSGVLKFCKQRILFPYLKLLGIMGLKPLHSDANDVPTCRLFLSKLYLFLVAMMLLAGYFIQFTTCFRRDIGFSYREDITNPPFSTTLGEDAGRVPSSDMNRLLTFSHAKSKSTHADFFAHKKEQKWLIDKTICSGNIIYIYLLPSTFHFLAFLYMVYLFWVNDDEHFQNLMERVFIQATHANINEFSQRRLIARMQAMIGVGCFWILLTTSVQIIQVVLTQIYINFWVEPDERVTVSIAALLIVTTMLQNAIQITVMASFAVHCHLICTYAQLLRVRLVHHSIALAECMKELGELGQLLHYLNNDLATGLAPLLLINGIYAAGAVEHLIKHGSSLPIVEFFNLMLTAGLWIFVLFFPLIQASKLSTCCFKLKDMGHMVRIRPFGYQFVSQFDLDSFLLFVSNLNLQVKILKVPVTAAMLSTISITLVVLMIIWGYFQ